MPIVRYIHANIAPTVPYTRESNDTVTYPRLGTSPDTCTCTHAPAPCCRILSPPLLTQFLSLPHMPLTLPLPLLALVLGFGSFHAVAGTVTRAPAMLAVLADWLALSKKVRYIPNQRHGMPSGNPDLPHADSSGPPSLGYGFPFAAAGPVMCYAVMAWHGMWGLPYLTSFFLVVTLLSSR